MSLLFAIIFLPSLAEVERLPPTQVISEGISFAYACEERLDVWLVVEPWREDVRALRRSVRVHREFWETALEARRNYRKPLDRRLLLKRLRDSMNPLDWAYAAWPPFVPQEYFHD